MIHSSWQVLLEEAKASLDSEYKTFLEKDKNYFPTKENYFNAFNTLVKEDVKYILFGQDPYPREQSAGGYAFIDTNVQKLFGDKGLSKEVNKATSLRNFIKMALVAREDLSTEDTSQEAIRQIDKNKMIDSIDALRINFEKNGVLLLNTALIFTDKKSSNKHIKAWRPFIHTLLKGLEVESPTLLLFGTHAKALKREFDLTNFTTLEMEHPYNHTFITNALALKCFGTMRLLEK